jgi:hypothetical protein
MRPRPLRSKTVVSAKSAGKEADDGDDTEHDAGGGTQAHGQKADEPMRRMMKIWSILAMRGDVAMG